MRVCALVVAVSLAGCSFIGVRAPRRYATPPTDPAQIHCTTSSLLPSIDAVTGSVAVAGSLLGIILQQTDAADDLPDHFAKYYAAPLAAVGIAYLVAASLGTSRVEACEDLKKAVIPTDTVRPIDMTGVRPPDPLTEPD